MSPKIKNAITFILIALVLVVVYVFLIKQPSEETNLVSVTDNQNQPVLVKEGLNSDKDFLPLLLNVKNIRLNDSIFIDPAFLSLVDSTITLTPDGNEGRINPFAALGVENNISNSEDPN